MKKSRCAHALCFVGDDKTGQVLQTLIDKCDVLNAVISDPGCNVFEKMTELKPVITVIEDAPGQVDGIELVQKIRRSEESPNIETPILLILSRATGRRAIDGSESGANQILTAPFTSAKLWECFEQALNDNRKFIVSKDYVGPERRGKTAASGIGIDSFGRRHTDH